MKNFLLSLLVLCASTSQAASVKISSRADLNAPNTSELESVPQTIMGLLVDQGLKFKPVGNKVYQIQMKDINCASKSNSSIDGVISGIPSEACRYNSGNEPDSDKGTILKEARSLQGILSQIENANTNVVFTDCVLGGRCYTSAKSITCQVDTKIETFSDGRFSCEFVDIE